MEAALRISDPFFSSVLASAVLVSCSQAPARTDGAPAPSQPAATASGAAAASGAGAAAATETAPRSLELPEGLCRRSSVNTNGGGARLRLTAGGAPFAQAGHAGLMAGLFAPPKDAPPTTKTEVVLLDGQPPSAGMTFETARIRVSGHVDPADVELYAAKAAVLGGFLIPLRLGGWRAAPGGLEATPVLGSNVEITGALPPWKLACDQIMLDEAPDPATAYPPAKKKDERMMLKSGQTVPLSTEPGGAEVARLKPGERARVTVLDRKGSAIQIGWSPGGAAVVGWVPASALEDPPSGRQKGEEGRMLERSPRPQPLASLVCDKDVALIAEVGGDRASVGAVRAGATIAVTERKGALARIHPPAPPPGVWGGEPWPDVDVAQGASFWVKQAEIEGCRPAQK